MDVEPIFGEFDRTRETDVFVGVSVLAFEPLDIGSAVLRIQRFSDDLKRVERANGTPAHLERVVLAV